MAGFFLHIELDSFGIKARIIEHSYKHVLIKDQCRILFKDLTGSEEEEDLFGAGMDILSQKLDLASCSSAIIFVSPLFVSFRNIELPFSSEKKAKQILPFEIEPLLPVINETYISDFHFIDYLNESNLFLTASIEESRIEKYFLKLESIGIKPLIIAPGGYCAAVRLLEERNDISTAALVFVTDSEMTLVLVMNKKPCFVRSFSTLLISPEDLALSVNQTIIGFNQRTGLGRVFDVFVSTDGDNHYSNLLYTALEKIIDCRTALTDIDQDVQRAPVLEKINSSDALASITPNHTVKYLFNFCQGKYGTNSFLKNYFSNIAAGAVLLFCVLAMLMLSVGSDNMKLEKKIAAIDAKALSMFTATFPDKKKVQDPYLQMKANVQEAIKKSGTKGEKGQFNKNNDVKVVEIIGELSNKITASTDMDISRFLLNEGRITLSGSTNNFNNVDNIKSKIESSNYFKKVTISSAAADKNGDRVDFKFIIEM